ncbi:MAG: hypothetical protein C0514_03130 [Candidatus Puniceispirillum sp.]|nr:hypothetical protein [Candidatus Puniceispirillum sp.]
MLMRKMLMAGVIGVAAMGAPSAKADMLADVKSVVDSLVKQGPAYACKKANIFGGTVTLRSFEGRLCTDPRIAAFTQAVCPQAVSDFANSGCDTKGRAALNGKTPLDVLKAQMSSAPAIIKTLMCKVSSMAPDQKIKDALSAACAG